MAGYLSEKDFINMVYAVIITNCPINIDDINNMNAIFGPEVPSQKGKTARRKPKPVISNYANTPKEILQL